MKNFQKKFKLTVEKRQKGFSLVELMVGVVIALIASVAIFQVFAFYQTEKQQTTTGSDALQNGSLAYYVLSTEIGRSGNSINTNRVYKTAPGENMSPLFGCQTEVFQVKKNNQQPTKLTDLPNEDITGLDITGTFQGNKLFQNGYFRLAPILIQTSNSNTTVLDGKTGQDILLTSGASTINGGFAPIKSFTDPKNNQDPTLITLGRKKTEAENKNQTGKKYTLTIHDIKKNGNTPLGFCATIGSEPSGYKAGSNCLDAVLAINKDLTRCTLTSTGFPGPKWWTTLQKTGKNAGLMEEAKIAIPHAFSSQDKDKYNNGYLMNLGRLDFKNVLDYDTENVRRSGFALFTVGKDGNKDANKSAGIKVGNNNLLRYDLLNNKLEVLADNIVLLKAYYGVSDRNDNSVKKRNISFWKEPKGEFSYERLMKGDDNAIKNIQSIRAVKVAVVARNAMPEEVAIPGNNQIILFKGNKATGDADPITINVTEEMRKYRYEIFEFIVPVQNSQYGYDQQYAACIGDKNQCK